MALPIEFPEVKIVAASAGAGKTYALAKRYLQLLFHPSNKGPDACRSILAITFTNKASREMKERILEFLKRLVLGTFRREAEKAQLLADIGMDEAQARQAAAQVLGYLIRNYNFFQVKTIDSFINSLLVGCAFKLNLSANFRIKHGSDEYLSYGLDALIDRASHNQGLRKLFESFLKQYVFVEDKRSWLPKQDMLAIMAAMFFHQNVFGRDFRRYDMRDSNIYAQQNNILKLLNKVAENLPEGTNQTFQKMLSQYVTEYTSGFSIRAFCESKSLLKDDIPMRKGTEVLVEINALWQSAQQEIKKLARLEAYSLFNCYIELFDQVLREFMQRTSRDDVVFVSELNRYAHHLLVNDAMPVPELYYRLAGRFRHYLMDEFQDTSVLQWQNLSGLVEEGLSTGGTLFCVGDRKQAIYRFRGGEPDLFSRVGQELSHFNLRIDRLEMNFRSGTNIVLFNNAVFSQENLRRLLDDMQAVIQQKDADSPKLLSSRERDAIIAGFEDSTQACRPGKSGGLVRVEIVSPGDDEEREEALQAKLFGLLDGLASRRAWRDIAILCRSNLEVEHVSEWLIAKDIPVESEKTLNLREHPYIKEVISLLMFLDSPVDELAFASFILGDIFTLGAGIDLAAMRDFLFNLYAQRKAKKQTATAYRVFQEVFPQTWDGYLEEFFKTANIVPLYELASSVYQRFGVLTRFSEHQGFFMRLLELIKQQEEEHASIGQFLRFFCDAPGQEMYVQTLETDAVRVMTVHKAKGLEFPVVIAPFLRLDPKAVMRSDRQSVAYLIDESEPDDELGLVRLHAAYTHYVPQIKQMYGRAYQQALTDELNNLYVACTRASDEFYAFIPERSGKSPNPAIDLVPEELRSLGEPQAAELPQKPRAAGLVLEPGKRRDWLGFLAQEFATSSQLQQRLAIRRGEILHALLAQLKTIPTAAAKGRCVAEAVSFVRPRFGHIHDFTEYAQVVERLLDQPGVFELFAPGRYEVFCEPEIVAQAGRTLRIDRLMVSDQEVRIIDFKSAAEPEASHLSQVQEYCRVAAEVFPAKVVRGFLLMLDTGRLMAVEGCSS